ncbi:SCO4225 family membrane protein [Streptomyces lateritius]|uniref:SCO4225 family membrane protein n=1 Tax=Streptomyces lateritius TaxID=67313 RepID=UPI0037D9DAF7
MLPRTIIRLTFANPASLVYLGLVVAAALPLVFASAAADPGFAAVWVLLITAPTSMLLLLPDFADAARPWRPVTSSRRWPSPRCFTPSSSAWHTEGSGQTRAGRCAPPRGNPPPTRAAFSPRKHEAATPPGHPRCQDRRVLPGSHPGARPAVVLQ